MNPISLASHLVDSLVANHVINTESGQALFDILADALAERPDIVTMVHSDFAERKKQRDDFIAMIDARLEQVKQDMKGIRHE